MIVVRRLCLVFGCAILWASAAPLAAQQPTGTITGQVVDSLTREPLADVTILVEGTQLGALTRDDGTFAIINVLAGTHNVRARRIGYGTLTAIVNVPGGSTVTVTFALPRRVAILGEMVVVGYTTQGKATITGAVSTVNMTDLESRRVPDVAQALQGQVAGVQVTQSTGAPGDEISIRIRGEGTIGNNSPLFIVDGIPSRDISFVNSADIQSMTVLKDASAASIYGSRASAGVIVVVTKSGKAGKPRVDWNYYSGVQRAVNLPKMLNASQYLTVSELAFNNSGYPVGTPNPYTAARARTDLANTNWLNALFETGHSRNVQLTTSGGSERVQYLMSAGYFKQDGIVVFNNDQYQRLSFRTNVNAGLTERLRIGTNLQLTYAAQDKLSSKGDAPGIIRHALIRPPIIAVKKDPRDPTYSARDPYTDLPLYATPWDNNSNRFEFSANPVALAYFTNDTRNNFKTFGNVFAEYAFLKDTSVKFRSNLGVDLNLTHNKAFNQNFGDNGGGGNAVDGFGRQNRPTSLNEDRGQATTVTWNNTLNYANTSEQHAISVLGGTEYITNYSSSVGGSRQRFDFASAPFQYLNYGQTSNQNTGGGASEWGLFSLFSSATYMFDSRYMITGNLRADASSRFAPRNQWGYFPSVSAGWKVSNEKFMANVPWVSDLKLRASRGTLGNQEISDYTYLTLLRRTGDQYVISRYGNPDLKWETTTQNNLGVDFGVLGNRLDMSVDYFYKLTSDILLPISLPSIVGSVSPSIVNAGAVENEGTEFVINYRERRKPFKYKVSANMSTVRNSVLKLHPNLPNIVGDVYRTQTGHPLGAFYGYVFDGIYQNQAEITSHLSGTVNPPDQPGDIRFRDLNGDGKINDDDRTFIGNPIPKLSYGFNFSSDYRGFDFSMFFQGVKGVDKYNDAKQITDYDSRPFNHTTAVLNAWSPTNPSNTIPRTTFSDNGSSKKSSIFVEDASYLRLKNIELGYALGALRSRLGVQNVRVYVSGQNLWTKTKYTGLDPESTDPLDRGTYPHSRAFLFGTNASF